jgi:hypothetical protein
MTRSRGSGGVVPASTSVTTKEPVRGVTRAVKAVAAVAAGSLGLTGSSGKGGFNSNPCMYGDGRNHGDPFPMSVPSVKPPGLDWDRTSASNGGVRRGEARSKAIRLSESISSLNALACSTAHGIRGSREKFFKTPASPPAGYSSGQLSVLGRAVEKIERYGPCPGGLTPRECFGEIIRSTDGYSMESKNVAPYQPELLKVLKDGGAYPKPAVGLLPPEVARALQEPQTFMIRSEEEMQHWRSSNPSFMPHWDETLKQSRSKRLELYKSLHAKGLLTYRRKIRSKCGIFFVWKSSKKGIRMIVDARMTNAFFRRPPRTRLGGGGALATLDTYLSDEEWAELKEEAGCFSEEPELEGATGDVQDAYFQYDLDELAEWFGFDDPFSAEELGVTFLQGEAVEEHERLFPCMRAMSQGWSWALHFCQAAVRHKMALGLGEEGRLVEEGLPAPSMLHGPVGSVYVDNLAVLGHVAEEVKDTFARVKGELVAVGFSLHELSEGEALIQNVGLVIDKVGQKLRHKNFRAWRLYLGLKYLLTLKKITGEVLRMFLGHIVHYCTLMRPALSILVHSYAVAFSSLGKTVKFPACVKSELRLFMGLIFVAEVNLAAPHSEEMGCGDASGRGYAFMTSRVSLEESRELHRHNERWRFIEVEVDRGGPGALQPEGWTADFEVAPSAYGNWMLQQAGLPAEGSGVLEQGPLNRKEKVRLKSRRIIKEFELVGSVPRLPEAVCEETRWRTIKEGRWNRNEAIHLKEGRVALMSLRRQSRVVRNHGKRFLTLNDNLSSLLAQAKGRAKRYDLTALCRRSAALQLGCDIPWHQRYIESERNPADAGSRRFVESRQQQGKEQGSSKQKDFLDRELHSRGDSEDRSGSLESPLKVMVGSSHFASTVDAQGRSCAGSKASTWSEAVPLQFPVSSISYFSSTGNKRISSGELSATARSKTALGPQATWGLREVTSHSARSAKISSSVPCRESVAVSGLELFAGSACYTRAMIDAGLRMYLPFEVNNGKAFNLSNIKVQQHILQQIALKRFWIVHLGTPCNPWSVARHKRPTGDTMIVAMTHVHFTVAVIRACVTAGVFFSLENPKTSALFKLPALRAALKFAGAVFIEYHCCRYGCSYVKPTLIASNCFVLNQLAALCNCTHKHEVLRGRVKVPNTLGVPEWHWKTALAGEYAPKLCHKWAHLLLSVAPAGATLSHGEPKFLQGVRDEVGEVAGTPVQIERISYKPCPRHWKSPWANAVDSWGT